MSKAYFEHMFFSKLVEQPVSNKKNSQKSFIQGCELNS